MFDHFDGRNLGSDDEHLYCLYLITLNAKQYVGQTNDTYHRFSKHIQPYSGCRYMRNAIQTYGWENAKIEILLTDLTLKEANRLETHYIDTLGTLAPDGYNLTRGGDNREWSEDSKKAQSERMKIVCDTPEFREAKSTVMKKLREDPKFIEANILSLKKMWEDPGYIEAQSLRTKKQWEAPGYREAHSQRMQELWETPGFREAQCEIFSISHKKRYEKEEEREKSRKSHAHMRKFTDEELIEMNEEFNGSVGKLSEYFSISTCVISRHKKRLGLTGKKYTK